MGDNVPKVSPLNPDPVLAGHSLVVDYMADPSNLSAFIPHSPRRDDHWLEVSTELSSRTYPRHEIASILRRQHAPYLSDKSRELSLSNLEEGGYAVITGQQVGLFTGPLYTIYKAMTAIKLAAKLSAKLKISVVPMFWLAADDHDIDEIDHATVFGADRELHTLKLGRESAGGLRSGHLPLGDEITALKRRLKQLLPSTADARVITEIVSEAYRPDHTYAHAFGSMLAALFKGSGLLLINPADSDLKRLMLPVFMRELETPAAAGEMISERSRELESAGYHAQVEMADGSTPLFCDGDDGRRHRVDMAEGGLLRLSGTSHLMSPDEMRRKLETDPDQISPNALLRPVAQDSIFPTIAHIMGPAELSYMAQTSPLYDRHGVVMPIVVPRARFTLVDEKAARDMERLNLDLGDTFTDPDRLFSVLISQKVGGAYNTQLEELRSTILTGFKKLEAAVSTDMGGLTQLVNSRMRTALSQVYRIEKKIGQHQRRSDLELRRRVTRLVNNLYPLGGLQERVLNITPFLASHGLGLIKSISDILDPDDWGHKIVEL